MRLNICNFHRHSKLTKFSSSQILAVWYTGHTFHSNYLVISSVLTFHKLEIQAEHYILFSIMSEIFLLYSIMLLYYVYFILSFLYFMFYRIPGNFRVALFSQISRILVSCKIKFHKMTDHNVHKHVYAMICHAVAINSPYIYTAFLL